MGRTYSEAVTVGTRIDGSHVRILRDYIQGDLNDAVASFTWTWDDWNAGQDNMTRVLAIHFTEMRDAIQVLWNVKGRGTLPGWTQETPQGPSTGSQNPSRVRATHVTDLRAWLNQYENNHPPLSQGIDSRSYDPMELDEPIIQDISGNDWTSDIKVLSSQPLFIRLDVRGRLDPDEGPAAQRTLPFQDPGDFDKFASAYLQYANQDMVIFPAFTRAFHYPVGADVPSASYRVEFANKLLTFVQKMHARGVDLNNMIIWNEPNDNPPNNPNPSYLTPENFASLMYRCWKTLWDASLSLGFMPKLYWGGLFSNADQHYPSTYEYARDVIQAILSSEVMNGEPEAFPWKGINLHMHRARTDERAWDLIKKTLEVQRTKGDEGELIIGEWGVTEEDGPDKLTELYEQILQTSKPEIDRALPDIMFFFRHHRNQEGAGNHWGIREYTIDAASHVYQLLPNPPITLLLRARYLILMNP